MINNIIARFKLGCFMTSCDSSSEVTELFEAILAKQWNSVRVDHYCVEITTVDDEVLSYWNANQYYAYASKGSIRSNGNVLFWEDEMPSMATMWSMVKALRQWETKNKPRLSSVLHGQNKRA